MSRVPRPRCLAGPAASPGCLDQCTTPSAALAPPHPALPASLGSPIRQAAVFSTHPPCSLRAQGHGSVGGSEFCTRLPSGTWLDGHPRSTPAALLGSSLGSSASGLVADLPLLSVVREAAGGHLGLSGSGGLCFPGAGSSGGNSFPFLPVQGARGPLQPSGRTPSPQLLPLTAAQLRRALASTGIRLRTSLGQGHLCPCPGPWGWRPSGSWNTRGWSGWLVRPQVLGNPHRPWAKACGGGSGDGSRAGTCPTGGNLPDPWAPPQGVSGPVGASWRRQPRAQRAQVVVALVTPGCSL